MPETRIVPCSQELNNSLEALGETGIGKMNLGGREYYVASEQAALTNFGFHANTREAVTLQLAPESPKK